MRTPEEMVADLQKKGRTPDQIRTVALAVRGGAWYKSVEELLKCSTPPPTKKRNRTL